MKKNIAKRSMDIVISFIALTLLFPLILLSALLIFLLEGSPIFYISHRLISPKEKIRVIKFRTMQRDANSQKYKLKERFMRDGFLDIPLDCEVYTPIGRVLERTQIVEIFQLINVIKGEMSIVGNRPLPEENINILKKLSGWEERFKSPAGITGAAQIAGKYSLTPEERLSLEIKYSSIYTNPKGRVNQCDLTIMVYTFYLLLTKNNLGFHKCAKLLERNGAKKYCSLPN